MIGAPELPASLRMSFHCAGDVEGQGLGEILEAVAHGVGRNETGAVGVAFFLVRPVAAHVVGLRNQVEGRVVGLLLIENVRELVVHRVEIEFRHRAVVGQRDAIERIDVVERHFVATFCATQHHCALTRVARNADSHDGARNIGLDKVHAGHFGIGIKPEIFGQNGQFGRFRRVGGHKVVVEVRFCVFEPVFELNIIRVRVVFEQPGVEGVAPDGGGGENAGAFRSVVRAIAEPQARKEQQRGEEYLVHPEYHLAVRVLRGLGVRPAEITSCGSWMARRGSPAGMESVTVTNLSLASKSRR